MAQPHFSQPLATSAAAAGASAGQELTSQTLAIPAANKTEPVGHRAAHGALSTLLCAALNKLVTFGTQIALAWFLVPEEFGLVALTLSVMGVSSIFGGATLRAILIQRSEHFEEVAGQVFWMGLSLNLATALLLVGAAPVAAVLFHQPQVAWLILVAAVAPPLQSLTIIHAAALNRSLKFGQLAMVQFCGGLVQNLSALALAAGGAGAMALVIPLSINAVVAGMLYRRGAGRLRVGRPQPRRWRELQGPVTCMMANTLAVALQTSGPNFVLGLVERDANSNGYYYWGFAFASQAIFLLGTNLQYVLFPALYKLNDEPARQAAALAKACRTLMVVVFPVIVLQALLAGPFVRLVFSDRWLPSIPVVQWISLGLASQPVGLLATSVLLAHGEFRRLAWLSGWTALSLTAAAAAGAWVGEHVDVARWVGVALLLVNFTVGWLVFRRLERNVWLLLKTLLSALGPGLPAAVAGLVVSRFTASQGPVLQITAVLATVIPLYFLLVRILQPTVVADVLVRLRRQARG